MAGCLDTQRFDVLQRRRGLKSRSGCKFTTEQIMSAQNVNFAIKFPKMGAF